MKTYAGIGSRETPEDILRVMHGVGMRLAQMGWTLRSGHADGADWAFEKGAAHGKGQAQIFLPWPTFNQNLQAGFQYHQQPNAAAFEMAKQFHPAWDKLKRGGQALQARNSHQILGLNLDQKDAVSFVICWTKDGGETGGTGQAIRIAKYLGIPIFNLQREESLTRVASLLSVVESD